MYVTIGLDTATSFMNCLIFGYGVAGKNETILHSDISTMKSTSTEHTVG